MNIRSMTIRTLFWLIPIAVGVGQAQAANFRWMNFSPERHFTEQDWEMVTSTADQALNQGKDGELFTWNNPDSGSSGSLTPKDAENREGMPCRVLTITNNAQGLSSTGTNLLCKQANGEWKIVK